MAKSLADCFFGSGRLRCLPSLPVRFSTVHYWTVAPSLSSKGSSRSVLGRLAPLPTVAGLRNTEIDVPVRDLDDDTMLRMMAHENRQEWGASAAVEQETIRAVVEAYAAGAIALPKPARFGNTKHLRYAPSFVVGGGSGDSPELPYNAETIQQFLGFKNENGLVRIKDTLNALGLIEQGVLRKEDVGELTVYKVKLVQQVAKEYEHAPEVQHDPTRLADGP
jgi:hypothetical protein